MAPVWRLLPGHLEVNCVAVHGDTLYAGSGGGATYAYDLATQCELVCSLVCFGLEFSFNQGGTDGAAGA